MTMFEPPKRSLNPAKPESAIVASVVPCQLPMNEISRRLPVALSSKRWAASLASDPDKPNQTFFGCFAIIPASRSARATNG